MLLKKSLLIRTRTSFVPLSGGQAPAPVSLTEPVSIGFAASLASRPGWNTTSASRVQRVEALMALSAAGYFAFALAGVLGVY